MNGSWRDISKIAGVLLALSLVAYNLYSGTDILKSLFRGAAAYLIFSILNILFTTLVYKIVHEFEQRRLEKLSQLSDDYVYADDNDRARKPATAEGRAE